MKHLLLFYLTLLCLNASAQTSSNTKPSSLPCITTDKDKLPMRRHELLLSKARYTGKTANKTTNSGPGYILDTARWPHLIDSTWGPGMASSDKMLLFNTYWKQMDSFYACFINLPAYNWDSVVNAIDTEIMHGVSEGRFAAICDHFMAMINDGHSYLIDSAVDYDWAIYPGKPIFRSESGQFGACITSLNDSEAMVYSAHPDHPFHLQPGDVILGYNEVPWLSLVHTILNNQLPNAVYKGSTDAATMHRYIQAAGENWYLFDTINIRKCDGSLVNLPTSLMNGVFYQDFATEQMPVPGVHMLTYAQYFFTGISISTGVISGKRIGYVYLYDCLDITGDIMLNAVKTLVEDSLVNGLVIDVRKNFGGGFNAYIKTFEYLNNGPVSWVGYGDRYDMNRVHLYNYGLPAWYDLADDDPHYFPHRVAILTGPNAVSAGDFLPVLFRHNPNVKVFGKSTAGAYGSSTSVTLPFPGYFGGRQEVNFFQVGAPTSYMTHAEVPVDSAVWFVKDSVCAGIDNIVSTAVQWIEAGTVNINSPQQQNTIVRVYPNPATNHINVSVICNNDDRYTIRICNVLGATVTEKFIDAKSGTNNLTINLDAINIPAGNYFISVLDSKNNKTIRKIAVVN